MLGEAEGAKNGPFDLSVVKDRAILAEFDGDNVRIADLLKKDELLEFQINLTAAVTRTPSYSFPKETDC